LRLRLPEVWGVLNVTPDSFSDGGVFLDRGAAFAQAELLVREGADVVDVGGESSRPPGSTYGKGAAPVSAFEELRRILPVIERLRSLGMRVSVDTVKADVAREAIAAGAAIINDVSCGADAGLLQVVAAAGCELVLMHNRGRGERRGGNVEYGSLVQDVRRELSAAVDRAVALGVARDNIWLDPGLGFAKTADQSLALLRHTAALVESGHRILIGASRKSFLAEWSRAADGSLAAPAERLPASLAAATIAVWQGAHAVRVHDVAATRQAVQLAFAAREAAC
jgi:dihydropteroate synthase